MFGHQNFPQDHNKLEGPRKQREYTIGRKKKSSKFKTRCFGESSVSYWFQSDLNLLGTHFKELRNSKTRFL